MIIIAPFARQLRNWLPNPKSPPIQRWVDLIKLIDDDIVQVGQEWETQLVDDFRTLSIKDLEKLIKECNTWVSIDSMFQHLAWSIGKPWIVIRWQGDPLIFGHKENINLLKSRKNLRPNQYWTREECAYRPDVFVSPQEVIGAIV